MLTINDLKPGIVFLYNNHPYQVLDATHLKVAQSAGMLQVKIKNLLNGNTLSTTFKSADKFEEAEVSRETYKFVYQHRGQFWFTKLDKPQERFFFEEAQIGENKYYLKSNAEVQVLYFNEKPIGIELPIKMDFEIKDAPPNIKGNTAQGGTKTATLETGLKIQVPLFIEIGDIVRVNTQTGQYTERVIKGAK